MNTSNREGNKNFESPADEECDEQFWSVVQQLDALWGSNKLNGLIGVDKIGRFELIRCLGEGAFGVVYLGFDPASKRKVALKIPLPESLCLPGRLESFSDEFAACIAVDHPGVVRIYESGFGSGIPYIACEYIDGPTLADWLDADQPLPTWQIATQHLAKIATAISSIHAAGILHGDLKPANILLQKIGPAGACDLANWNPKICDFGLACQQHKGKWPYRNGIPLGSPKYLAPELFSNPDSPLGPALDVYSFGIMMFELLTGQHPFEAKTFVNLIDEIRFQNAPSLLEFDSTIPHALDDVVQGCLCKKPVDRNRSFPALVEILRSIVP